MSVIYAPVGGKVHPLSAAEDPLQEAAGAGVEIHLEHEEGQIDRSVVSPINGRVLKVGERGVAMVPEAVSPPVPTAAAVVVLLEHAPDKVTVLVKEGDVIEAGEKIILWKELDAEEDQPWVEITLRDPEGDVLCALMEREVRPGQPLLEIVGEQGEVSPVVEIHEDGTLEAADPEELQTQEKPPQLPSQK